MIALFEGYLVLDLSLQPQVEPSYLKIDSAGKCKFEHPMELDFRYTIVLLYTN